jgi:hypothetical protein
MRTCRLRRKNRRPTSRRRNRSWRSAQTLLADSVMQAVPRGGKQKVSKDSCAVRVSRPSLPHDVRQASPQHEINPIHLLNGGLPCLSCENVAQRAKHCLYCAAVNANICAVQVAQRLADSIRNGFADIPGLSSVAGILSNRKSQFKWHIEAGHSWRSCVELNAREVMDGISALPDEIGYSFQPAPAGWDFQGRAGYQPKGTQTGDIRQIQVLERAVVRDIQEYGIPLSASSTLSCGHISRLADVRWPVRVCLARAQTTFAERALPQPAIRPGCARLARGLGRAYRL